MAKSPEKIKERVERGNIELSSWLDRLDKAHKALREFVGYNGQPSRLRGGPTQWFEVPKDTAISVTPPPGAKLQGGLYFASQEGMRATQQSDPKYTAEEAFTGGVAIRAYFHDDFLEETGILADLICVQQGPGNEPVIFSQNRPNRNFFAGAVEVPNRLRTQVAIAVVDGSVQPI